MIHSILLCWDEATVGSMLPLRHSSSSQPIPSDIGKHQWDDATTVNISLTGM